MSETADQLESLIARGYQHGFVTDIESDTVPPGLDEDVVRLISTKKNEPRFMLEWRLKAYRHWLSMTEPRWPNVHYPPIDYQNVIYYSAPKPKNQLSSLDPDQRDTVVKIIKSGGGTATATAVAAPPRAAPVKPPPPIRRCGRRAHEPRCGILAARRAGLAWMDLTWPPARPTRSGSLQHSPSSQ